MTRSAVSRARCFALLAATLATALRCAADDAELRLFEPDAGEVANSAGSGGGGSAACTSGAQCPPARPLCSNGGCVECAADDDCVDSDQRYCDLETHACVACRLATDCGGSDAVCRLGACFEACQSDGDCTEDDGSWCDAVQHICIECASDRDCLDPSEPACVNGTCVECASDAQCGADKPGCRLADHRCRECSSDAHCPLGQTCDLVGGSCR
jgi:Cys-rich repeat protein